MQAPDGMTPLQSLLGRGNGNENLFPGYIPSLRSLQRVGSKVINKIIENWDRFKATPPT
jgi:purine nucleoside permease